MRRRPPRDVGQYLAVFASEDKVGLASAAAHLILLLRLNVSDTLVLARTTFENAQNGSLQPSSHASLDTTCTGP